MHYDESCSWPRCRSLGEFSYYTLELCVKHHDKVVRGDPGVGHALLGRVTKFKFQEGCYCPYCRPQQYLPTPSWELPDVPEHEEIEVAGPPEPDMGYPRKFTYMAKVDGQPKKIETLVFEPVTLANFATIFSPYRVRFKMTSAQKEKGLSREAALAEWVAECSHKIEKP